MTKLVIVMSFKLSTFHYSGLPSPRLMICDCIEEATISSRYIVKRGDAHSYVRNHTSRIDGQMPCDPSKRSGAWPLPEGVGRWETVTQLPQANLQPRKFNKFRGGLKNGGKFPSITDHRLRLAGQTKNSPPAPRSCRRQSMPE